jgi:hypothetical protein
MSDAGAATFNGTAVMDGNSWHKTNKIAYFGDGLNLQISSDGTNANIAESGGSGNLVLSGQTIRLAKSDGEIMLEATNDAGVDIRHNHVTKLQTTASGVDITGGFTATSGSTITVSDNSDNLTLTSTDADGNAGPNLRMYRNSSSPDDGNDLGVIDFEGRNDNSQDVVYAQIKSLITDQADGAEFGKLELYHMFNGSLAPSFQLTSTEVVINESSNNLDFRVESDGNANMLFCDAGSNIIGIGTGSPQRVLHIIGTDGTTGLTEGNSRTSLFLDNAGANYINIASANNAIGGIFFSDPDANNRGAIKYNHSSDALTFNTGATEVASFHTDGIVFNEDSNDQNFRIESNDNTHMFFVDAGNNHIIMGTHSDDLGGVLNIRDNSQVQIFAENGGGGTQCIILKNTAGSFNSRISTFQATRNSSSGFDFSRFISNDGNDTEMVFGGSGDINIDGSVTPGGVDYAEYFEWKDGNSSDEDRRGHSVILDEEKIVVATSSDDTSKIIGIVSTNPSVVGGGDIEKWVHKYLRDDYDSLIWEEHTVTEWTDEDGKDHSYDTDRIPSDVTAPSDATVISEEEDKYGNTIKLKRKKLNPEWDSSQQYISREDRKEWEAIGLVGKLRLKKGEPTNPNWIKLRDISDSVEEWLVR